MPVTQSPSAQITDAVTAWPGVTTAGPGERGEFSFLLGRHEIGHLHGDRVAHFSFKRKLGAELREQGRVTKHPITDSPGLAARRIEEPADVAEVVALMRLNYERLVGTYGVPVD
jgi:hypothetical protein